MFLHFECTNRCTFLDGVHNREGVEPLLLPQPSTSQPDERLWRWVQRGALLNPTKLAGYERDVHAKDF